MTSILKHFTSDPHSDLHPNDIKEWNVYKDAMLLENSTREDYVIKRLRLTKASRGGMGVQVPIGAPAGSGPGLSTGWLAGMVRLSAGWAGKAACAGWAFSTGWAGWADVAFFVFGAGLPGPEPNLMGALFGTHPPRGSQGSEAWWATCTSCTCRPSCTCLSCAWR